MCKQHLHVLHAVTCRSDQCSLTNLLISQAFVIHLNCDALCHARHDVLSCRCCLFLLSIISAIAKGLYSTVGKILAYSIVHRGPMPTFFSPLLFRILSEGNSVQPNVTDIRNDALREQLHQVLHFSQVMLL